MPSSGFGATRRRVLEVVNRVTGLQIVVNGAIRVDPLVEVIQVLLREEQRLLLEEWPAKAGLLQLAWAGHVMRAVGLCRRVLEATHHDSTQGGPMATALVSLPGQEQRTEDALREASIALQELVGTGLQIGDVPDDLSGPPRQN
jgi:hypothetical protein